MSVTVAPCVPAHRPALEALLRRGLREQEVFAAAVDPPEDAGFFEAEMAEHLEGLDRVPEAWRVAVDERGTVTGLLWRDGGRDRLGPYATVRQIIVAPSERGRGVGTALLRTAEAEARATDAVMMLISAFRSNPALRLYRALGFVDFPPPFRLDPNPEHVVLWKCFRPGRIPGAGTTVPALRPMRVADAGPLSRAFREIGWSKPEATFEGYVAEQSEGLRFTQVVVVDGEPAGYVTLVWASADPVFAAADVPEIVDLNVLPHARGRGFGSMLVAAAEQEAWSRSSVVGLRVGLHPGYGAAQRLYARRGYVPDGRGVVVDGEPVAEGAEVVLDDDANLRMTKRLAP